MVVPAISLYGGGKTPRSCVLLCYGGTETERSRTISLGTGVEYAAPLSGATLLCLVLMHPTTVPCCHVWF
eukprot:2556585-Rhodomonas_salina.2